MAQQFAESFYNSSRWRKLQKIIKSRAYGLCEICGKPGHIVHHMIPLTADNIDNPNITLNSDLLIYVCLDCHNKIHGDKEEREIEFDVDGNVRSVCTFDYKQYILDESEAPPMPVMASFGPTPAAHFLGFF